MENNVGSISRKINGAPERPGLLAAVRGRRGAVVSMDDGRRYWLCVDGSCWVWDYELSPVSDAAWFYLTDIHAVGFLRDEEGQVWHLNADGQITQFVPSFSDYGRAIRKSVTLPAQTLGGYERYKDVDKVILSLRSATSSRIALTYLTDYEMRRDETDVTAAAWQLVPRNLAFRSLALQRFAAVAVRRPACRHVRHISVRLENEEVGMDMAVVSAQIFWKYAGRDK